VVLVHCIVKIFLAKYGNSIKNTARILSQYSQAVLCLAPSAYMYHRFRQGQVFIYHSLVLGNKVEAMEAVSTGKVDRRCGGQSHNQSYPSNRVLGS
jgi:hypothetical protein